MACTAHPPLVLRMPTLALCWGRCTWHYELWTNPTCSQPSGPKVAEPELLQRIECLLFLFNKQGVFFLSRMPFDLWFPFLLYIGLWKSWGGARPLGSFAGAFLIKLKNTPLSFSYSFSDCLPPISGIDVLFLRKTVHLHCPLLVMAVHKF